MIEAPVIAIVDDDHSVRRALERLIRSAGYSIRTFASGEEFIESLRHGHPACLVLDIHLDGMSGFALQEHLAANEMSIPVIFVTAYDDHLRRQRIERSGAIAWLWKPLDQEELLRAIGRALAAKERT
jgi:FixJ family two-component response regulator